MHSQAQERNPRVFEPLKIGHVEVPNRIHMPPHVIGIETPVPGHEAYRAPAEDFAAYHGERASWLVTAPTARNSTAEAVMARAK